MTTLPLSAPESGRARSGSGRGPAPDADFQGPDRRSPRL